MWLTLEAFKDDPISIILFENVPRILTRGRTLLDQISSCSAPTATCSPRRPTTAGRSANLAQSRKRFLLVARHPAKVPPFLYQPTKHKLRGVGEVIGLLPLPGDLRAGGPMHRVPRAAVEDVGPAGVRAGRQGLAGAQRTGGRERHLRDYGIVPDLQLRDNQLGVLGWDRVPPRR
jgi:site-specific DNA-cytosine methylase